MGAPDQDLDAVVAQREQSLRREDGAAEKAPWGPGLAAAIESAGTGVAGQSGPPSSPPQPTRARVDAVASPVDATALDDLEPIDLVSVASSAAAAERLAERARAERPLRAAALAAPVHEPQPEHRPADRPAPDIAEETRQQLARLYDARLGAPAVLDTDGARSTAAKPGRSAARPARPTRPGENAVRDEARRRRHRKVVALVAVALVVAFGGRSVQQALANQDAAVVQDPTTPVDRLPWRDVRYGQVAGRMPTAPATSSAGGEFRYERYVLPDVVLTVSVRPPVPGLASDAALRGYAAQSTADAGGRMLTGFSRDLGFATSFSASIEVEGTAGYLYVLSTPQQVIAVQADVLDAASGRAERIYEQVIRSFGAA